MDVPTVELTGVGPAATSTGASVVGSISADRVVAVFGGVERRGRWRVRARNQMTAVFGGVEVEGPRPKRGGKGSARPGPAALDPAPHRMHDRQG